jgi:iron(II)-dependent oxidoreductase
LASRMRDCDPMLNSAIIPHAERWKLAQLTSKSVSEYLESELEDTLNALEKSTALPPYFFQLALYHEDMHAEAMLMTLQTLGLPAPQALRKPIAGPTPAPTLGDIEFEGGEFEMGSQPGPDFAFDNETPARLVHVAPFALASTVVINADYLGFVEEGGYRRQELWSPAGWHWRESAAAFAPGHWRKSDGVWLARRFDGWEPLAAEDPVMQVNAYEAEAYCRFAGRRLPTEAEWEFAARADQPWKADRFPWGPALTSPGVVNLDGAYGGPVPAASLPGSDTRRGLRQMIGNVWEWTSTAFAPYPGFVPGPYQEYSEPWFHTHRVLRGGSFPTRARLVHNRWRNFYTPERRDIFAGIRPARSL